MTHFSETKILFVCSRKTYTSTTFTDWAARLVGYNKAFLVTYITNKASLEKDIQEATKIIAIGRKAKDALQLLGCNFFELPNISENKSTIDSAIAKCYEWLWKREDSK